MTGLAVERLWRAASPSSPSPAEVSTPLPPHIQGAERRRSRWGLRLLVVGGLAGAAWLLTGAAAHAADRTGEPDGSLLSAVVGGDATAPVSGLLAAAAQPLEAEPAHRQQHHIVSDILAVPQRVLARPAETVRLIAHDPTGTTVDTAKGGVDTVLHGVAEPLRLTGGPEPAPQRMLAVAADPVSDQVVSPAPAVAPEVIAPARATSVKISKALPVPTAGAVRAVAVARQTKPVPHRIVHRHRTARPAAAERATAGGNSPGGDGSTTPQLHLGDVSGTPTSGSGTRTEGASAAFLPDAIANSTVACRLLPIAAGDQVRRHDAEAPTVSPD
ncbi:hypothetical protein [Actinoplanes subtropicus]|uniref:hypothetical protein n=1 Tax=Actinoplanes subtropicus TaxID=543632 RepID=UPI0004C2BA02|nr:hypothetical protein [Actinoplanes subtropicus]